MKNIVEIIKIRHSTRVYKPEPVADNIKQLLLNYIGENAIGPTGEKIQINLIEKNRDTDGQMKLNYGLVKNQSTYLLGKVNSNSISRLNYGFVMEKVVLKATELNLASCWIGYFDASYFPEIQVQSEQQIPSLVIIGNAESNPTLTDKIIRKLASAKTRKSWDKLFFQKSLIALSVENAGKYAQSLEMLRLAPSAGNTQPWRVVYDNDNSSFHFYKEPVSERYEKAGLHDIDLGIALAHFDLALAHIGIPGKWYVGEPAIAKNEKWIYSLSWKEL